MNVTNSRNTLPVPMPLSTVPSISPVATALLFGALWGAKLGKKRHLLKRKHNEISKTSQSFQGFLKYRWLYMVLANIPSHVARLVTWSDPRGSRKFWQYAWGHAGPNLGYGLNLPFWILPLPLLVLLLFSFFSTLYWLVQGFLQLILFCRFIVFPCLGIVGHTHLDFPFGFSIVCWVLYHIVHRGRSHVPFPIPGALTYICSARLHFCCYTFRHGHTG